MKKKFSDLRLLSILALTSTSLVISACGGSSSSPSHSNNTPDSNALAAAIGQHCEPDFVRDNSPGVEVSRDQLLELHGNYEMAEALIYSTVENTDQQEPGKDWRLWRITLESNENGALAPVVHSLCHEREGALTWPYYIPLIPAQASLLARSDLSGVVMTSFDIRGLMSDDSTQQRLTANLMSTIDGQGISPHMLPNSGSQSSEGTFGRLVQAIQYFRLPNGDFEQRTRESTSMFQRGMAGPNKVDQIMTRTILRRVDQLSTLALDRRQQAEPVTAPTESMTVQPRVAPAQAPTRITTPTRQRRGRSARPTRTTRSSRPRVAPVPRGAVR